MPENLHLSDAVLLLAADGEFAPGRQSVVTEHLENCMLCRGRMSALQNTLSGFAAVRERDLTASLPSPEASRARLRARLADASLAHSTGSISRPLLPGFSFSWSPAGRFALAGAAFFGVLLVIFQSTVNAEGPKPRLSMTPGETRPITLEEVCLYRKAEVTTSDIPEHMRQQVFAEYGIRSPQANQFEVDYLITPDLGGTESIRNLWPQPYSVRWNARVKDKLEARLHDLVCNGELDLTTAQHDIAVDWIAAYKKYVGPGTAR